MRSPMPSWRSSPSQLIVGDMQDAAGLTNITFRYRQTDTKLKPWSPTEV